MKKIFSLLSAALLFAGSVAFTGCDEANEIFDEVLENKGVWFEYNVQYGDEGSESSLICYVLYSDSEYKNNDLSSKAAENQTLPAGLTLVVKNDSGNPVGQLANNTYAIHTFEKGKKVSEATTTEGDDLTTFSKFEVGSGLWNAFYLYNVKTLKRTTGVPPVLLKSMQNTFTPITSGFKWKKVLAQMLVDGLLE